ncbi:MAG: DNA/RNA nuclease SfsA [Tissierellia bacterium]|nr:DNA/RNA nuclease SfsA [Tissierellia bacterium]
MKYENTVEGIFLKRENRFIAKVEIEGEIVKAHVPNTGRCKELFIPGVRAVFTKHNNPNRKTKYTLIHIWKEALHSFVNIVSVSANTVAKEGLLQGKFPFLIQEDEIFTEKTYGNSRFDFYINSKDFHGYMEVKGVTLEENGLAKFPDAPTLRGVKHIKELIKVKESGLDAGIIFIMQMGPIKEFSPHTKMQLEFTNTLLEAKNKGVEIYAFDSLVTKNEIVLQSKVPINLGVTYEDKTGKKK